jgi:HSP20 family protein
MFKDGIDEWFDRMLEKMPFESRLGAYWKSDVEENEKEVLIRMEVPGFDAKDIDVRLAESTLVVEAKTPEVKEKGKTEVKPRRYFRREMTLPMGLELAKLEAVYRNGVLEIRVPRSPEVMGRRIDVKS